MSACVKGPRGNYLSLVGMTRQEPSVIVHEPECAGDAHSSTHPRLRVEAIDDQTGHPVYHTVHHLGGRTENDFIDSWTVEPWVFGLTGVELILLILLTLITFRLLWRCWHQQR